MSALVGLALLVAACSSSQPSPTPSQPVSTPGSLPEVQTTPSPSPTPVRPPPTPTPNQAVSDVTVVDTTIASVPLEGIAFDTFDGSFVRLPDATDELILRLRDVIPPLNQPLYIEIDEVDYLDPDDLVLGYSSGDEHYAYPFQILNFHEFVNEEIDGVPVLISYCPICRSAIVFDRRVDGTTLTFGNTSAVYESAAVAYDTNTGSYWHQPGGKAIVGPLTGKRLTPLPSITTTWEEWQSLYPGGLVLSTETGYQRPYERDFFARFELTLNQRGFSFPVSEVARDSRLAPGAHVLVVLAGDSAKGYPLDDLGDATINDEVGGENVVVFSMESGPSGAAYRPSLNGQELTFEFKQGHFVDVETGSTWNLAGMATAGASEGESLEPVPILFTFWFGAVTTYPDIVLYSP